MLDNLSRISACIESLQMQRGTIPLDAILAADQHVFISKTSLLACTKCGPASPMTGLMICSSLISLVENLKEHAECGDLLPTQFATSTLLTSHSRTNDFSDMRLNQNSLDAGTRSQSLPKFSSGVVELQERSTRRCVIALLKWKLQRHIQVAKELNSMGDSSSAMHQALILATQELNRKSQELLGMISLSCRSDFV
jgi:hypothetical protein